MNEILQKLKIGFPEYDFDFQKQNTEWSRAFIVHKNITLGRISFKNNKIYNVKFYKPSLYEYEDRDKIFYLYDFYLSGGKLFDLDEFVKEAKKNKQLKINEILRWRKENPKYDKEGNTRTRPKINTNWMPIFRGLVCKEIERRKLHSDSVSQTKV